MNKNLYKYIFGIIIGLSLAGYLYAQTIPGYDETFNAAGTKTRPIPTGHAVGKDNGPGEGLHNSGENCGICHTPNGKAGNFVFTVGGTIYADRAATRPLQGAEVVLQDSAGNVISMTTNEVGNFWTFAKIASNPYTIASHSGITDVLFGVSGDGLSLLPIAESDSRSWLYKAWIRNPDGAVRSMITIAPVGGATGTSPRMGCNMHHSPFGSTGAAWASRESVRDSYPATGLSFQKHIQPIFYAKCAPCHVPGASWTRLVTMTDDYTDTAKPSDPISLVPYTGIMPNASKTSIDLTNGMDLTAYADYTGKKGVSGYVNIAAPNSSMILAKTKIGGLAHGGGTFWTETDADYKAIYQWMLEGALNN